MCVDWSRTISSDDAGRQPRANAVQVGFGRFDHRDGVGARLPANIEHDRRDAVQPRERTLLFGAVFGAADVAHANRRAVARGDDQIVELIGVE